MTESIMKTNDNFYASAVDPNVASYSNIKDLPVSMDDLRDFSDQGLHGLRQLVEIYEDQLDELVLDLVPYLVKFHHEYDESKHTCIAGKLKANCANKELVLVASEQLSLCSCPNSYPLLLPLCDLSQPYNANWLADTILNRVTNAVVCDTCVEKGAEISYCEYAMDCLSSIDISHCSVETLRSFEKLALFLVETDKKLLRASSSLKVKTTLGKLSLGFSEILIKSTPPETWDPRCVIIASHFPHSVPLVYDHSWLFSNILPWLLLLVEDIGGFVDGDDVRPILDTTMFFTKQNLMLFVADLDRLKRLFDFLISIAVNNTSTINRTDASKSLSLLSLKYAPSDRLKLIKHYSNHESGSVSGLFIDMFKTTLAKDGGAVSSFQFLKVMKPLLRLEDCDVLESSNKVLAILSLIQLVSSSPHLRRKCSDIDAQLHKFTKHIEDLIRRRQIEIKTEVDSLKNRESSSESTVLATISVQGEEITEPTVSEQLQSLQLAKCRLDLIIFNLVRTVETLENFSNQKE